MVTMITKHSPALRRIAAGCLLATIWTVPAAAQTPERRAFVTLNGAAQTGTPAMTDQITFTANAESGTIEARYPARTARLFEGSIGYRFARRVGIAAAGSQAASSGSAGITASVPHPLYDDRHRLVEGDAAGITRRELAAHLQLFYEVPLGRRLQLRLAAGPSWIQVEQDVVHDVAVDEDYPFDTATFRSASTRGASASGVGFNLGADVSWMFSPALGAGVLLRYVGADIDLNTPDSGVLPSKGGGVQVGGGLRFRF